MKTLILIVLLLLPLSACKTIAGRWPAPVTRLDVALAAIDMGYRYADFKQTSAIVDNPDKLMELNSSLGPHPTQRAVNKAFIMWTLKDLAISYLLPKPYRNYFQLYNIGKHRMVVLRNEQVFELVGVKVEFW